MMILYRIYQLLVMLPVLLVATVLTAVVVILATVIGLAGGADITRLLYGHVFFWP